MSDRTDLIKLAYTWGTIDLRKLFDTLRVHLPFFLGDDFRLWGSIEESGEIPIEHKFTTLDDVESLSKFVFQRFSLYASSQSGPKSLDLFIDPSSFQVNVRLEVLPADVPSTYEWAKSIASELGMVVFLPDQGGRVDLIRVERTYIFRKSDTPDKIIEILNWLGAQYPFPVNSFQGDYRMAGSRFTVPDLSSWKGDLNQHWGQIEDVSAWLNARLMRCSIDFNPSREELGVSLEKPDKDEINKLFLELERRFTLEIMPVGDRKLVEEERKFFTKKSISIDQNWLESALSILLARFTQNAYFVGRYKLLLSSTIEARQEQLLDWKKEVLAQWTQLANARMRFDQRHLIVDLRFDPLRDLVELQVGAVDRQKMDEMFEYLVENLGLELVKEEPFRYRKSSGQYEILDFGNKMFAEAVETALRMFVGEKHALVDAFIELGPDKNGELQKFSSLQSYLQRAADPESYADTSLYVQAPRGIDLSITTASNHQRLWLGSTLEPKEFSQLEEVFKKRLTLKEIQEKPPSKEGEKEKQKPFLQDVVKIAVTALLAFLLSAIFWSNIFPKYNLKITVPQSLDGKPVSVQINEIPVEWVVEREQWFQKKVERDKPARIRVLKEGLVVLQDLSNQRPGVVLSLFPGMYDIEVIDMDSNISHKVRIEVQSENLPTPTPP